MRPDGYVHLARREFLAVACAAPALLLLASRTHAASEAFDRWVASFRPRALAKGISTGAPLERATLAAMRDAAAKFLVQFPEQPAGQKLAHNEALVREQATAGTLAIEAVPIEEAEDAPQPPPAASPSASPPPPAPAKTPQAPGA